MIKTVRLETAKLLKEAGFRQDMEYCWAYFPKEVPSWKLILSNTPISINELKSERISAPTTKTPYRCPICLGCGNVPGAFYNATIGYSESWSAANAIEQCKQCKGTGIIWSIQDKVCSVCDNNPCLKTCSKQNF